MPKLSEGTVSRALNGYADIGEATAERVRAAASAMSDRELACREAAACLVVRQSVGPVRDGEPD